MAMQKGVNKIKGAMIIKQSTSGKVKVFTKDLFYIWPSCFCLLDTKITFKIKGD
jgi:hypothetical protein